MIPSDAPVTRLIANVGSYVAKHPDDAEGTYVLGRIYYLAFAQNRDSLSYYDPLGGHEAGWLYNQNRPGKAVGSNGGAFTEEKRAVYAKEALRKLQRSVELDPRNGLYQLGLACVYEDGHALLGDSGWREQAIKHYLAALRLSIKEELKQQPVMGLQTLISYEAGTSYLRLLNERGVADSEEAIVKGVREQLSQLQRLPMAITPIVLALHSVTKLSDLLAPGSNVRFDLDGTGREQSYEWLRPDTALLVWDPQRTGRIQSGRQLFGSVTWWIFWKDGYRALAALDDDHDGWLSGRELAGLALWFDRNQNGVSDPGEVIPIEQTDIVSIAAESNGYDGASPMNSRGVRLKNGFVFATWDWVATPIRKSESTH